MNKKTDEIVVILSHLPWDFPTDYIKQTSLELAKRATVVVFSPIRFPTLRQLIFERKDKDGGLIFFKKEGIDFFPSFGLLPFQRFELIRRININLNFFLFRFLYQLKFGSQKPIFWGFSHELTEVSPYLRWGRCLIYDRPDQIASLDPVDNKRMKQKDCCLLRSANFVLVNSQYSLKYVKKYNNQSFMLPWGCAVKLFFKKRISLSQEIKKIKKPRVGLVGHIDHRLNLRLLYGLASNRRSWNFILVGPVFDFDQKQSSKVGFYQWLERVERLPNVYFLGQKPKEKMPDFIAGFDACLILYDVSQEFVKGCNPMKLYEYLAMGKPVVSTPIEAVVQYSPFVKIANNVDEFGRYLEEILKTKNTAKMQHSRKMIGVSNSWRKRVDYIFDKILKIESL